VPGHPISTLRVLPCGILQSGAAATCKHEKPRFPERYVTLS